MKITALLAAVTLAATLTSGITWAQTTIGTPDCGEWIKSQSHAKRAWLVGYLSGMSTLHHFNEGDPKDPLRALQSADQAFLWMDNFCQRNPLKTVSDGGADLFVELMKKKINN